MKYKAFITDVAGTLINNKYIISPRVKNSINLIKDKVMVSLCSGRVYDRMSRFVNELELTSLQISDGGGEIYDPIKKKAVHQKIINERAAREITQIIKQNKLHFVVSHNSEYYLDRPYMTDEDLAKYQFTFSHAMPNFSSITDLKLTKISILGINEKNEKLVNDFLRGFSEDIHFIASAYGLNKNHTYSAFDITDKSATKLTALEEYVKLTGIKLEETIVVGDGYNDFPLLMAGGLKVAMGNAVDDLKSIADYVTSSVNEDGLAEVIEKFLI